MVWVALHRRNRKLEQCQGQENKTHRLQRVDVPHFDGAVETRRRQLVRVVRLELAVKYCLDVTLQNKQEHRPLNTGAFALDQAAETLWQTNQTGLKRHLRNHRTDCTAAADPASV